MKRVDFYYDFSCPYAYLAHTQIEALCAREGAELIYRPFLLGGLFRLIGAPSDPNQLMPPSKARLNELDRSRWADHLGMVLNPPAAHPCRTMLALRAAIASADLPAASKALFAAYWRKGLDVAQPEVVRAALDEAGLRGEELVRRAEEDSAVKEELRTRTEEAAQIGVFGAPTFLVNAEGAGRHLFWGQDRLLFVEKALRGWAAPPALTLPAGNPR